MGVGQGTEERALREPVRQAAAERDRRAVRREPVHELARERRRPLAHPGRALLVDAAVRRVDQLVEVDRPGAVVVERRARLAVGVPAASPVELVDASEGRQGDPRVVRLADGGQPEVHQRREQQPVVVVGFHRRRGAQPVREVRTLLVRQRLPHLARGERQRQAEGRRLHDPLVPVRGRTPTPRIGRVGAARDLRADLRPAAVRPAARGQRGEPPQQPRELLQPGDPRRVVRGRMRGRVEPARELLRLGERFAQSQQRSLEVGTAARLDAAERQA